MNTLQVKTASLILAACLLVACAHRPPVTSDYDTSYNFSQLKTYAWLQGKGEEKVATLDNKRDINAIETILNRKGFNKSNNSASASFLLKMHTVTDKKVDVDHFYSTWGYHPFYNPNFYGWPQNSTTIVTETEIGTLILDIVDAKNKQVIWRGTVAQRLGIYNNLSPEERASNSLRNAEAMLNSFPPGATSSK